MNSIIKAYFVEIELRLLEKPLYTRYLILRKEIVYSEGKIRLTIELKNEDTLELFEYLDEKEGKLSTKKYSYHWQDKEGKLIQRWDNAPHHRELEHFPHHIHFTESQIIPNSTVPNILTILDLIELRVNAKDE